MFNASEPLSPLRSPSFPYPDLFAYGVSPLGPVCYFDSGPSPHSDVPIVLVHALGLDFTQWEHVVPLLTPHARVIGIDLPGCGRSAKPRHRYRQRLAVDAIVRLLDYLGIERAVLVGHSFGGAVCTRVALRHPERVAGLMLINSSGFTRYSPLLHLAGRAVFRPPVIAPLVRVGVRRVLHRIFATQTPHTEAFVRRILARPDPRYGWEFAYYACPMIGDLMRDVLDDLHRLTMPTVVLWGAEDRLLPMNGVADWVRRLPRGRLHTLPACGHMPNLEAPEAVGELGRALHAEAIR